MHSHLQGHPALIEAVKRLENLNCDQFELYFVRKTATKIDCRDQKVDSLSRSEDLGLSIRMIQDQRMGFSFTTSLETDAIGRAVSSAAAVAALMPQDPNHQLFSFGSLAYPEVDSWDARGLAASTELKIALAMELEAKAKSLDARIKTVRAASLSEIASEVHMVDSNGEHIHHKATIYAAALSCKAEQDGDSQMGWESMYSNYLDNIDTPQVARLAVASATELLGAGAAPTMKCPAVIRNDVMVDLLDFLSSSFSSEAMEKGQSMLAGRQGERIASELVTLVDDGLMPGGIATSPFDGEGIPSSKTTLIDGGFMVGAFYNSYYGRKLGKAPTGNSSRGIKSPPSISTTNLYMQPGKKAFDTLVGGITRGILITHLLGVHTANAVTGDFSLGASGILIENGKLTRPVKGFAVAGNVLELFRKITDVGSDLRFFGSVGSPSVRIGELAVAGV